MPRLLIYSEAWGRGGIETFVRNIMPFIVEAGWDAEVISTWDWGEGPDPILESLGVCRKSVFEGWRPGQVRRLVKGLAAFNEALCERHHDAVWVNTMNGAGFLYALAAKAKRVPIRVVHSHNSDVGEGVKTLKRILSRIGSLTMRGCSTRNVACSMDAGRHLFGSKSFDLIPNGIDTARFRFNEIGRAKVRRCLGVGERDVLVGSIGRVCAQKNPMFQVQVFSELKQIEPSARYLMVGKPDCAEGVRSLAGRLGVLDSIIILGAVDDPEAYYWALDAFLMPSVHEGFPFASLEAQCASLPVVCSDNITPEIDVTELVYRRALNEDPRVWAETLLNLASTWRGRRTPDFADRVAEEGYSVEACAERVLRILGNGA